MIRIAALLFALLSVAHPAHAQTAASPSASTDTSAKLTAKSSTKSPAKPSKPKAPVKQGAPAETGPCTIGVVAAIGTPFMVKKLGLMVFGNENADVPIESWGLDDLVVARVRAAARAGAGVRRITPSQELLNSISAPLGGIFGTPDKLVDAVRQSAGQSSCERYVVVTKSFSRYGSSNQSLSGVGILQTEDLRNSTFLFALTYIRVFDGRTFAVLKEGRALGDDESLVTRVLVDNMIGPHRRVEKEAYPRPASESVYDQTLRDGVRALLSASLDRTLPDLLGR